MGLDKTGPDGSDVGGGADDEQDNDDHAIEVEECALDYEGEVPWWWGGGLMWD